MVISTIPLWLIGLDLVTGRLRRTSRVLVAPVAGLVGIAVIANPRVDQPTSITGTALILAAAASWAIGSRRSRSTIMTNSIEHTAMQMLTGGLILLAVTGLLTLVGRPIGTITPSVLAAIAWLIAMSSMIGFTAYTYALHHAPITAVAAYPYVNTMLAVALGTVLLHEPITANRIVGTAIVLASVAITLTMASTTTPPNPTATTGAHRREPPTPRLGQSPQPDQHVPTSGPTRKTP